MKLVIDRFEENFAVCESETGMDNVKCSDIPNDAAEGDTLVLSNGRYLIDREDTEKRRKEIEKLQDKLFG